MLGRRLCPALEGLGPRQSPQNHPQLSRAPRAPPSSPVPRADGGACTSPLRLPPGGAHHPGCLGMPLLKTRELTAEGTGRGGRTRDTLRAACGLMLRKRPRVTEGDQLGLTKCGKATRSAGRAKEVPGGGVLTQLYPVAQGQGFLEEAIHHLSANTSIHPFTHPRVH